MIPLTADFAYLLKFSSISSILVGWQHKVEVKMVGSNSWTKYFSPTIFKSSIVTLEIFFNKSLRKQKDII